MPTASSGTASIDPFERTRLNTLRDIFQKDSEYQWQIDLLEKHGYNLGNLNEWPISSRMMNRNWPRDPEGKEIIYPLPDGYMTPNSTRLWGSTLFDFFFCILIPKDFGGDTGPELGAGTGSMLSAWMKANGELEYAKLEMAWAEAEEKPKLRLAADLMEIINARDLMIMMETCGTPMRGDCGEDSDDKQKKDSKLTVLPFDYENYPHPWPLVPFSSKPPALQSHIPLHILPETLIVHDPFGLLHARSVCTRDRNWTSVEDITHKYHLNLVDSIRETIAAERAKAVEAASSSEPVVVGILFECSDDGQLTASGNAYRLTVPPPPPPPSSTSEAHLFISPTAKAGEGHHSIVYHAEWDLPRSVFSKPKVCVKCVEAAAREILRERVGKMNVDVVMLGDDATENIRFCDTFTDDTTFSYDTTPMSTLHIDTVPWYDPASTDPCPCPHIMKALVSGSLPGATPPTALVSVVAKLSIMGDRHLETEALNYQRFGSDFSQHWTGYTLTRHPNDRLTPTPMGAIVPNFYGYYSKERTSDYYGFRSLDSYFSPILLLEECGTPIEPDMLDLDDKQECAALLLRMHHHGWTQGSFFPRNILMQLGDHGDFPLMRSPSDKRFRLIDFGRGKSLKDAKEADRLRGDEKKTEEKAWCRGQVCEKKEIESTLEFPRVMGSKRR
ncbi:hypothetical protein BT96DRAFT_876353 [Gymnopus androsaceus JB14]|uniref:Protein kinase domain-containing protein n=1 Tax=Gymnopus androsaceus JB14 TaxID=1447944 RepID=A0A6A4I8B9_9AGAR|nr:hypothetical protein BT96DRAFT_876353 [Gymnopus androsaceus JB14]